MKARNIKSDHVDPGGRFERTPNELPFRANKETEFERLKNRLLAELLNENPDPDLNAPFRRAANEAASLAWLTPVPSLVYPVLFAEKALAAARYEFRQREIRWATPRFEEAA